MTTKETTLQVQGVYNTLYHAITQPDQKFVITRYFLEEWVPLLGPTQAWLIVALRQRCFWNKRQDWCIVDKATLAKETAIQERTIERHFKKQYPRWFVLNITHRYRYHRNLGKKVRDKNRYQLLLNEPLSPRHQLGLANLLKQTMADLPIKTTPLDTALLALQAISQIPNLPDKISYAQSIPKSIISKTVWQILEDCLDIKLANYTPDPRLTQLDQLCAKVYNLIIQPNKVYVGWQYYRLNWVPLLGHALGWLIIYLRRFCYWDEKNNQLRDEYTFFKKDLAAAIGQTPRNLANLMQNPHASLFFTSIEKEEDTSTSKKARNKPTRYQIRLTDEPLTPTDQTRIQEELYKQLQNQFYGQDPESGQLNIFPILANTPTRQNFAYGQVSEILSGRILATNKVLDEVDTTVSEKMSDRNEKNCRVETISDTLVSENLSDREQKKSRLDISLDKTSSEKMSVRNEKNCRTDRLLNEVLSDRSADDIGKNDVTFKRLLSNDLTLIEKEQQTNNTNSAVAQQNLKNVLDKLAIQEPTRSRLLTNPNITPIVVQAWMLYAKAQPQLNNPLSYAIKRLLANDLPPGDFISLAQLSEQVWIDFEKASYWLKQGYLNEVIIAPEQLDVFIIWIKIYTDLDPLEIKQLLQRLQKKLIDKSLNHNHLANTTTNNSLDSYAQTLWQASLKQLQLQMTRSTFNTWLKGSQGISYQVGKLLVGVRTAYAIEWLENRLATQIERTVTSIAGEAIQVTFTVIKPS